MGSQKPQVTAEPEMLPLMLACAVAGVPYHRARSLIEAEKVVGEVRTDLRGVRKWYASVESLRAWKAAQTEPGAPNSSTQAAS